MRYRLARLNSTHYWVEDHVTPIGANLFQYGTTFWRGAFLVIYDSTYLYRYHIPTKTYCALPPNPFSVGGTTIVPGNLFTHPLTGACVMYVCCNILCVCVC